MNFTFLFFFVSIACYSQSKTAKGIVLDEFTQKPIPYVNISILESSNGTSSYDDGSYKLEIEEKDFDKNVHLSALGYKDSILSFEKLIKQNQIFLKPIVEQLEEVVISNRFEQKFQIINPIERKKICSSYATIEQPWMIALYIPYDEIYRKTSYLNSIKYYFQKFQSRQAKFRVRLFSVGEDGLPNADMLTENMVISKAKRQHEIEVELSKFNLVFPSNGIYIALEWLYIPFNEHEETFHMVSNDKRHKWIEKHFVYEPKLSAICGEIDNFKIAAFSSGIWLDYSGNKHQSEKKIIPAISLTLSN